MMRRTYKAPISVFVLLLGVFMAILGGWLANIYKLAESGIDPLTLLTGLRLVGIFVPPLGTVLGYL